MSNRKNSWLGLPLALLALVLLTGLRPVVRGGEQRGLLATGFRQAKVPAAAATMPVVLPTDTTYPHNLPLVTLAGQAINLSDLKGKVVFVNLWASWCPPCVAEMPGIQALYEKMDPEKVAFVMISFDGRPARAQAMLKHRGYTFPVYFPTGPLPAPFDSNAIPATFILGPDGQVAARYNGLVEYDTPAFEAALEQLAAATDPPAGS